MTQKIQVEKIDNAIKSLKTHLKEPQIKAFIVTLEALKTDPQNEVLLVEFSNTFNNLGIEQGAVLTYAPYVSVLLSDDPFGDD